MKFSPWMIIILQSGFHPLQTGWFLDPQLWKPMRKPWFLQAKKPKDPIYLNETWLSISTYLFRSFVDAKCDQYARLHMRVHEAKLSGSNQTTKNSWQKKTDLSGIIPQISTKDYLHTLFKLHSQKVRAPTIDKFQSRSYWGGKPLKINFY